MTTVCIPFHKRRPRRLAGPRVTGIFAGGLCEKSYKRHDFVVTEPCDDPNLFVTEPCDEPDFTTTPASRSLKPRSRAGNLHPETFRRKNRDMSSSPGSPGPEASGPCRWRSGLPQGCSSPPARRQAPKFAARNTTRPDKTLQEPDDRTTRPRQEPAKPRQEIAPTRGDGCAVTVIPRWALQERCPDDRRTVRRLPCALQSAPCLARSRPLTPPRCASRS